MLLVLEVTEEQQKAVARLFQQKRWRLLNIAVYLSSRIQKQIVTAHKNKSNTNRNETTKKDSKAPCKQGNENNFNKTGAGDVIHGSVESPACVKENLNTCNDAKLSLKSRNEGNAPSHISDAAGITNIVESCNDSNGTTCDSFECFDEVAADFCGTAVSERNVSTRSTENNTSEAQSTRDKTDSCSKKVIRNHKYLEFGEGKSKDFESDRTVFNNVGRKPGKYMCSSCERVFNSRAGIYSHVRSVHKKRYKYHCETCDKSFLFKPHYVGHMNRHRELKPFICDNCGNSFCYKQSLNLHKKNCNEHKLRNSKQKQSDCKSKVLCDICGAALSSKSALKQHHAYLHSDKPKQVCHDCGKCFKTEATLKRHLQISHQDFKMRRYSCDLCSLKFKQLEVLRQHVLRHKKEFSVFCETCGKGFYTQFKLKEHQRIHTGEKPFVCSVCHKYKSSTKSNLLKHLKSHERRKTANSSGITKKTKTKGHKATKVLESTNEILGSFNSGLYRCVEKDSHPVPFSINHIASAKETTNTMCTTSSISKTEEMDAQGHCGSQGHLEGHLTNLSSLVLEEEVNRYNNSVHNLIPNHGLQHYEQSESYYGNITALSIVNRTQY